MAFTGGRAHGHRHAIVPIRMGMGLAPVLDEETSFGEERPCQTNAMNEYQMVLNNCDVSWGDAPLREAPPYELGTLAQAKYLQRYPLQMRGRHRWVMVNPIPPVPLLPEFLPQPCTFMLDHPLYGGFLSPYCATALGLGESDEEPDIKEWRGHLSDFEGPAIRREVCNLPAISHLLHNGLPKTPLPRPSAAQLQMRPRFDRKTRTEFDEGWRAEYTFSGQWFGRNIRRDGRPRTSSFAKPIALFQGNTRHCERLRVVDDIDALFSSLLSTDVEPHPKVMPMPSNLAKTPKTCGIKDKPMPLNGFFSRLVQLFSLEYATTRWHYHIQWRLVWKGLQGGFVHNIGIDQIGLSAAQTLKGHNWGTAKGGYNCPTGDLVSRRGTVGELGSCASAYPSLRRAPLFNSAMDFQTNPNNKTPMHPSPLDRLTRIGEPVNKRLTSALIHPDVRLHQLQVKDAYWLLLAAEDLHRTDEDLQPDEQTVERSMARIQLQLAAQSVVREGFTEAGLNVAEPITYSAEFSDHKTPPLTHEASRLILSTGNLNFEPLVEGAWGGILTRGTGWNVLSRNAELYVHGGATYPSFGTKQVKGPTGFSSSSTLRMRDLRRLRNLDAEHRCESSMSLGKPWVDSADGGSHFLFHISQKGQADKVILLDPIGYKNYAPPIGSVLEEFLPGQGNENEKISDKVTVKKKKHIASSILQSSSRGPGLPYSPFVWKEGRRTVRHRRMSIPTLRPSEKFIEAVLVQHLEFFCKKDQATICHDRRNLEVTEIGMKIIFNLKIKTQPLLPKCVGNLQLELRPVEPRLSPLIQKPMPNIIFTEAENMLRYPTRRTLTLRPEIEQILRMEVPDLSLGHWQLAMGTYVGVSQPHFSGQQDHYRRKDVSRLWGSRPFVYKSKRAKVAFSSESLMKGKGWEKLPPTWKKALTNPSVLLVRPEPVKMCSVAMLCRARGTEPALSCYIQPRLSVSLGKLLQMLDDENRPTPTIPVPQTVRLSPSRVPFSIDASRRLPIIGGEMQITVTEGVSHPDVYMRSVSLLEEANLFRGIHQSDNKSEVTGTRSFVNTGDVSHRRYILYHILLRLVYRSELRKDVRNAIVKREARARSLRLEHIKLLGEKTDREAQKQQRAASRAIRKRGRGRNQVSSPSRQNKADPKADSPVKPFIDAEMRRKEPPSSHKHILTEASADDLRLSAGDRVQTISRGIWRSFLLNQITPGEVPWRDLGYEPIISGADLGIWSNNISKATGISEAASTSRCDKCVCCRFWTDSWVNEKKTPNVTVKSIPSSRKHRKVETGWQALVLGSSFYVDIEYCHSLRPALDSIISKARNVTELPLGVVGTPVSTRSIFKAVGTLLEEVSRRRIDIAAPDVHFLTALVDGFGPALANTPHVVGFPSGTKALLSLLLVDESASLCRMLLPSAGWGERGAHRVDPSGQEACDRLHGFKFYVTTPSVGSKGESSRADDILLPMEHDDERRSCCLFGVRCCGYSCFRVLSSGWSEVSGWDGNDVQWMKTGGCDSQYGDEKLQGDTPVYSLPYVWMAQNVSSHSFHCRNHPEEQLRAFTSPYHLARRPQRAHGAACTPIRPEIVGLRYVASQAQLMFSTCAFINATVAKLGRSYDKKCIPKVHARRALSHGGASIVLGGALARFIVEATPAINAAVLWSEAPLYARKGLNEDYWKRVLDREGYAAGIWGFGRMRDCSTLIPLRSYLEFILINEKVLEEETAKTAHPTAEQVAALAEAIGDSPRKRLLLSISIIYLFLKRTLPDAPRLSFPPEAAGIWVKQRSRVSMVAAMVTHRRLSQGALNRAAPGHFSVEEPLTWPLVSDNKSFRTNGGLQFEIEKGDDADFERLKKSEASWPTAHLTRRALVNNEGSTNSEVGHDTQRKAIRGALYQRCAPVDPLDGSMPVIDVPLRFRTTQEVVLLPKRIEERPEIEWLKLLKRDGAQASPKAGDSFGSCEYSAIIRQVPSLRAPSRWPVAFSPAVWGPDVVSETHELSGGLAEGETPGGHLRFRALLRSCLGCLHGGVVRRDVDNIYHDGTRTEITSDPAENPELHIEITPASMDVENHLEQVKSCVRLSDELRQACVDMGLRSWREMLSLDEFVSLRYIHPLSGIHLPSQLT